MERNATLIDNIYASIYSLSVPINRIVLNIKSTKNWYSFYYSKLFKRQVLLKLKNGFTLKYPLNADEYVSQKILYFFKELNVKRLNNKYLVKVNGIKFYVNSPREMRVIDENFIRGQYDFLDVKGKDVVDIGANIGDTAIFFSKVRKAKRVIAFEPFPYTFKLAKENLDINKISNVLLKNEAVGSKTGFITINPDFISTAGTDLRGFPKGKKIKVTSLSAIVSNYNLDGAVLKMDCEGYEYPILLNSDNRVLRQFKQMVIECHYGYLNIEKKLKSAGFDVTHSRPHLNLNSDAVNKKMFINLVYATRKD